MAVHNQTTNHSIALSFSDASFWCYDCDSYIKNQDLFELGKTFGSIKHNLILDMSKLTIEETKPTNGFTYNIFIDKLKNKKFKKIVFLTGAGMSVTAGIPDFRTKGTGLYSQLEKYNLPQPESVFEISFFKQNPKPFYILSKAFLDDKVHPTINHMFISEINKQGMLLMNFSQNIDGLDVKAGVPDDKLVEAHGNYRSAHCTKCHYEKDINIFYEKVKKDEIYVCEDKCKGYIKPDIVFFGEALPERFFKMSSAIEQADLVIIMGTSLKVFPFASMVGLIPDDCPLVCINRSNPGIDKPDNFLFVSGDMDDNVEKIMKDCGWEVPKIQRHQPDTEYIKNLPDLIKKQEESKEKEQEQEKKKPEVTE